MAGIDSFTKLMLHCNGSDASTTFTDDSESAHTVTAQSNAQIDTAQSKFGGASGFFNVGSDRLDIPDSEDWNFGSGDFTIDFWAKFQSLGSTSHMCSQWEFGNDKSFSIRKINTNVFDMEYRTSGGSNSTASSTFTLSDLNWHHYAVVRDGNTLRFFVDGVAEGTSNWTGIILNNAGRVLHVSSLDNGSQPMNGWIDELRISKGVARWTSAFTPPTQEYTSVGTIVTPSILNITSNIQSPTIKIDSVVIPNILTITSQLQAPAVGQIVSVTPNVLTISSSIKSPTTKIDTLITPPILTITSTLNNPIFPVQGSLIAKIISVNPLIAVTDTSPVQIIKIDTTDPNNLDYTSVTIPNINNAKDVTIDFSGDYVYVAGNNGKVVKVEIADLTNQTTIDLSDTDDILTIEHNANFGITYAGTDNDTGEIYTLDERNTFKLDSDFTCLTPQQFKLDTNFSIVSAFKMDSAFTALSYQTFKMGSDFKCLTKELTPITSIDDIIPINLEDYQVFVNSVELENTDLVLNSISITHSVGEESRASFQLSRKHDQLNTTLEGISSIITNQNIVEIKIKGITEFLGKISELNCEYQDNTEFVTVNALMDEKENKFNKITMSLPGLNSRLSLYDILLQNPNIYNPYVDPNNEDNPKKYKGIRVDLGTKIIQSLSKWTIFDSTGSIADSIQEGTFDPIQNWSYFWSPTVTKIVNVGIGETSSIVFLYIGTSLAPVSEDLWDLNNARHWRQRIFDDIETELGFYEVGEAPFKDISVRNGQKITKPKLTDEPNGLYSITDASYNFINFAKEVAELEYEQLKNINGNILPDTSCTFNLTIDAYFYYTISLLTQINIDNTTQSNIYQDANGFPISVKSITITSQDRRVSINADNQKSTKELEVINSQFPDENDDEYNEEEQRVLIALKSDMRTRLKVE